MTQRAARNTIRDGQREPGRADGPSAVPDDDGIPAPDDDDGIPSPDNDDTPSPDDDTPSQGENVPSPNDEGTPTSGRSGGRRAQRRILKWVAAALALLLVGSAGALYVYYRQLNGNIKQNPLNLGDGKVAEPTPNAAGQTPLNILLIGSDARDSEENQELGGARETFGSAPLADVQMLLHLSADRTNMSVVSMPRDTLVQIPKCTDPEDGTVYEASNERTLTNQSLGHGGPGCTVATWEELTGIRIDHFVMVDFAGVVSMADAVGGVPVCVDANILSRNSQGHGSGLKLAEGTHPVKGEQALQWLRTRYGFEDGSDLARAKAQHMYMNSLARELRENTTLSNPNKLRLLAEEATRALTVDPGLDTVKKLYDLSTELRKVKPERITMTTMPNRYVGARVEPTEDAEQLFRLVRDDIALDGGENKPTRAAEETTAGEATAETATTQTTTAETATTQRGTASAEPAAPDAEIEVRVLNGTRTDTLAAVSSRAGTVAELLREKGFTGAAAEITGSLNERLTLVRYPSADLESDALRVAESLGVPESSVRRSTDVSGVTVVVGADWREGTAYEAPEQDDTIPESAEALNGADDSACMEVDPNYTWS